MKALRAIFATLGLYLALSGPENNIVNARRRAILRENDNAFANLAHLGLGALSIVGVILAAVIGLKLIAALFPTYSGAVSSIAENFTTADWGDPTANDLSPIFALLAALGGLLGLAGLVITAVILNNRRTA